MADAPELVLTSPAAAVGDSHQFWPTPRWVVDALIAHGEPRGWWPALGTVLDPACGEGAILDVWAERDIDTLGLEIDFARTRVAQERGHRVSCGNALARSWPAADLCCLNPPYGDLAEPFVQQALRWLAEDRGARRVCALLRVPFLEPTGGKAALFAQHPPDVLILPRRPKFDGQNGGAAASAWFCWPSSASAEDRLVWLP